MASKKEKGKIGHLTYTKHEEEILTQTKPR